MNEIYQLLKERLGLEEKEANETFNISDEGKEWKLTVRSGSLESKTFYALFDLAHERGGGYAKKPLTFTIPKTEIPNEPDTISKEPISEIPSQEIQTDEDYSLAKSLKGKYGQIVPCLADAQGEVFDGLHRKQINEKAWTVKVDQIKTAVDRTFGRMISNKVRRQYKSEELTKDIGFLIGAGFSLEQINGITGISERTLIKHKPSELKQDAKVKAGLTPKSLVYESAEGLQQTVKTSDTLIPTPSQPQEPIIPKGNSGQIYKTYLLGTRECEKCGAKVERDKMHFVDNLLICPKCAGKDKPLTVRKLEEEPTFKPKEKADFRRAVMQPEKSKLEMDLFTELANRGITPETDKWICLWGTKPDGHYPEKKIAYYVHGEPHDKGKTLNRDDEIKGALEKEGWTVFVFRHDQGNVKEWADTIQEALKW